MIVEAITSSNVIWFINKKKQQNIERKAVYACVFWDFIDYAQQKQKKAERKEQPV